jgi:D-3-phosphoglycerate dehydrogenase
MTGCGKALKMLKDKGYAIRTNPSGKPMEADALKVALSGCDGVIAGLDRYDGGTIRESEGLKVISRYGVGVDNVDLKAATECKIPVAVTPGANTEAVADLAFALMMATARSIVKADALTRAGGWPKIFGSSVYGKCVGVVGTGAIGRAFARRLTGFSARIMLFDVKEDAEFAKSVQGEYVTLEKLLGEADFVSVHVPLNTATRGMIGKMQLASMKSTSYLINTARGGIVDEEALADALDEGIIAGAGIDVYMHEPPAGSRLALSDKVVMTPHMGSYTRESVEMMGMMAAENLIDALEGRKPKYLANPEVYTK